MKKIIVLIPGIMGSELWHHEKMVWPGRLLGLMPSIGHRISPFDCMEDLLRADLVPKQLIFSYYFSSQYRSIVNVFNSWGFLEDASPPTLYLFPYDWRKPNETAADQLAQLLERVTADHPD